jgi:hypothetical protein
MDVPERIYVKINHPISSEYTEIIAFEEGDGIEYCRTDAFIEKTCNWIKEMFSETNERFNQDYTGMLIEDFKKTMKS